MTDNNLAERIANLKAAAEKATPGPWGVLPSNNGNLAHVETQEVHGYIEQGFTVCSIPKKRIADAEHIAASSPDAVLALIAHVEELEREVAELNQRTLVPWIRPGLIGWSIVGMNHFTLPNGVPGFVDKWLYVAMTKGDRCIRAQGVDQLKVWDELEAKADEILREDLAQHTAAERGEG